MNRLLGKFLTLQCAAIPLTLHISQDPVAYQDETALFYENPHAFVYDYLSDNVTATALHSAAAVPSNARYSWPSHLVVFDELLHRSNPKSGQYFGNLLDE